jgi:MFS family permease
MATLEYPIGKLIDKYNKKYFLAPCYLLVAFVIFGYIFVNNVMQLFMLQVIWGIAIAIGDPSWDAWFSDIISKKSSGFSWGMYHMVTGYSAGFSALLGGIVGQFFGFSVLFTIGGSLAIISFFIILFTKPEKLSTAHRTRVFHTHRKHLYKRRMHVLKR